MNLKEENIEIYDIITEEYYNEFEYKYKEKILIKRKIKGEEKIRYVVKDDFFETAHFILSDLASTIKYKLKFKGFFVILIEEEDYFIAFIGNSMNPYDKFFNTKLKIAKGEFFNRDVEKFHKILSLIDGIYGNKKFLLITDNNVDYSWINKTKFSYKKINTINYIKLIVQTPIQELGIIKNIMRIASMATILIPSIYLYLNLTKIQEKELKKLKNEIIIEKSIANDYQKLIKKTKEENILLLDKNINKNKIWSK
jgi:hypothetical protein